MGVSHIQGPVDTDDGTEGSHRDLADVVAGQLHGALASYSRLGIPSVCSGQALREGGEAVQLLNLHVTLPPNRWCWLPPGPDP